MVKMESYLSIEASLVSTLGKVWKDTAAEVLPLIHQAMVDGDTDKAVELANSIDLAGALEEQRKYLRYLSYASMLFGASRVTDDVTKTAIATGNYSADIGKSMTLLDKSVLQNMEDDMRVALLEEITLPDLEDPTKNFGPSEGKVLKGDLSGQDLVDNGGLKSPSVFRYRRKRKAETKRYVKPLVSFRKDVQSIANEKAKLVSTLHSSRLSAYGFTVEARATGLKAYAISEQLDNRICPVCRHMHGKRFNVDTAANSLREILDADEPDDLKVLQPWPKQDKRSLQEFKKMNNQEIADHNWHIPPYHPGCRGQLVKIDDLPELTQEDVAEINATKPKPTAEKPIDRRQLDVDKLIPRKLFNQLLSRQVAAALAPQSAIDFVDIIRNALLGTSGRTAKRIWRDLLNYYTTEDLEAVMGLPQSVVMLGKAKF